MVYTQEKYEDIIPELDKILPLFYKEVDIYPENPTPDINHELLSNIPELQVVTAREDGKLVGFHIALIENDIFYKTLILACVLFYYLHPDHRGEGRGTKMFEHAEKLYKEKDVDRVFMSRKIYINNEKMFTKLGYTHLESNYTKAIK